MTRYRQRLSAGVLAAALAATTPAAPGTDEEPALPGAVHGYARNGDVRLHYVSLGEGPLVVMLHGFPDYWYTWRHLMPALADRFQTVALDLRGYNRSDRPPGVESYQMGHLVADVGALVRHLGRERAIVLGHDWGAAVAWGFGMFNPQMTEALVILSVPHPSGFLREMATNPEQQANSQYARDFQRQGAHESLTAEGLAQWVEDPAARERYVEAFRRSDFEAMLNYYKAIYPRSTGAEAGAQTPPVYPRIQAPVLILHGLEDRALDARGHDGTWQWLDGEMTLVTLPGVGHFLQHEATERVNRTIRSWLLDRR